jgi:hypothetical protein
VVKTFNLFENNTIVLNPKTCTSRRTSNCNVIFKPPLPERCPALRKMMDSVRLEMIEDLQWMEWMEWTEFSRKYDFSVLFDHFTNKSGNPDEFKHDMVFHLLHCFELDSGGIFQQITYPQGALARLSATLEWVQVSGWHMSVRYLQTDSEKQQATAKKATN